MKPHFKQPAEALIWEWDFAAKTGEAIQSIAAVTIAARGRVAEVAALAASDQGFDGQRVRVQLEGGTDGESYLVTVRIVDAGGQEAELDAEFLCADLGWIAPDGTTPYLTIAEMVEAFGYEELVRLTDELGTRRIDKARLIAAIMSAQAEADGYLASRYTVPLTAPIPLLLKNAVRDRARFKLYNQEAPEGVKTAAADALRTLRDLATGTMKLPQAETPPATSSDPVMWHSGGRTYPPGSLDGY